MSYRESHLEKGLDYDQALVRDPLDAYMARREHQILLEILPRLARPRLQRSLDFACGTGRITQLLDAVADQSFAVDVSGSMVAAARPKCPHTTFFVHDMTDEPLPIEPVQLVTAFRFFGNAENGLRGRALEAIGHCLVPGGYLVFNNHENPWAMRALLRRLAGERGRADLHFAKLRRLLARAGFRVRRTYGIGMWLFRARLQRPELLNSRWSDALERLSAVPFLRPFCPDVIIVAQRS